MAKSHGRRPFSQKIAPYGKGRECEKCRERLHRHSFDIKKSKLSLNAITYLIECVEKVLGDRGAGVFSKTRLTIIRLFFLVFEKPPASLPPFIKGVRLSYASWIFKVHKSTTLWVKKWKKLLKLEAGVVTVCEVAPQALEASYHFLFQIANEEKIISYTLRMTV